MKKRPLRLGFWIALCGCAIWLAACNPQPPAVVLQPTATLLPPVSLTPRFTATPAPSRTPLPTFTFTPSVTPVPPSPTLSPTPTATPTVVGIIQSLQRVNVREGPGTQYGALDALAPGTGVQVMGVSSDGAWYQIRLEDGDVGWIAARLLYLQPTLTPFPSPTPSPNLTALFLGTPLPTAFLGGGTITPTPPSSITTATVVGEANNVPQTTQTPTQSFLPVVNVASINMTATALVANAATVPPNAVNLASATPASSNGTPLAVVPTTDAGGLTQDQVNALTGIDVFAFCDRRAFGITAPQNLTAGSTIDIYWAWFARSESQVRDHINAAIHELSINGQAIAEVDRYRTVIRPEGSDFSVYWYVPFGPLAAGEYRIAYRLTWQRAITDGYMYFGPGTSVTIEEESCTFTVR